MARQNAPAADFFAGGTVHTHVGGVYVPAGEPLPAGTTSFTLTYFSAPDANGNKYSFQIQGLSTKLSLGQLRGAIAAERIAIGPLGNAAGKYPKVVYDPKGAI